MTRKLIFKSLLILTTSMLLQGCKIWVIEEDVLISEKPLKIDVIRPWQTDLGGHLVLGIKTSPEKYQVQLGQVDDPIQGFFYTDLEGRASHPVLELRSNTGLRKIRRPTSHGGNGPNSLTINVWWEDAELYDYVFLTSDTPFHASTIYWKWYKSIK